MIFDDIRYALRQFAKSPGFTATAILTLALGIGATTAIFTLVYAILLKSLPVADPSSLIRVGNSENCCINGGLQDDWSLFSYEQYKEFRDNTPGFAQLAAFEAGHNQIGVRREGSNHPAESLIGNFVSGNAFDTLGVNAYAGRLLKQSDDEKGAAPVAVMSYRTWQQKFGQDQSIVGAHFLINGQPFTIVGITPPGFFGERLGSDPASFWIPLNKEPLVLGTSSVLESPELNWLNVFGRLRPGVNQKQIEAELQVELRQFLASPLSKLDARDSGLIPKQTLHLSPGGAGVQRMQEEFKDALHLLMWISGFVLLIACANLANLMLVRATNQRQKISVQAALGAPRSRLVGQALTESVVLAVLGGIASLIVAYGGARMIVQPRGGQELCSHRSNAVAHRSWVCLCGFIAHGNVVWRGACLGDRTCRSDRRIARREPHHEAQRLVDSEGSCRASGSVLAHAALRSRLAHAEPAQPASSGLRLRYQESIHPAFRPADGGL